MQIWLRTHSPSGNKPIVRCWPHHGSGFRADLAKQAAFPTFQVSKQKALVSVRACVCLDCRSETQIFVDPAAFTGTDRGLLRSVLGPRSPVPKCETPGAPISVEEHTSMAPRPRRQSQNPPLQKSSAIPALPWPSKPRLRYPPGLAPTTRLKALLHAASDS